MVEHDGQAPKRTRKSAAERRSDIVEAVIALAAKLGPERITAQAIAEHVGLSQAAVFRHFPTMEAVWQTLSEHVVEEILALWEAADPGPKHPGRERAMALLQAHCIFLERRPGMPLILMSREIQARNRIILDRFLITFRALVERLAKVLAEAQAKGEIRASLDPVRGGWILLGILQSVVFRWVMVNESFPLQEETMRLLEETWLGIDA